MLSEQCSDLLNLYHGFSIFVLLQEHWLPYHNAPATFMNDLPQYSFNITSSDMFLQPEDIVLNTSHCWHGTAIGWLNEYNSYVSKIPLVSKWLCGVKFKYNGHFDMRMTPDSRTLIFPFYKGGLIFLNPVPSRRNNFF